MSLQQRQRLSTPIEQLRETLDRLDVQIGTLNHASSDESLKILPLFDTTQSLIANLTNSGADLTVEITRFGTASGQFRKKGDVFLRKIGGTKTLDALRAEHDPDAEHWWWFIDRWLADQKRARLRQQGKTTLIGLAIFAVLAVLYTLFLAPDEATRKRIEHQQNAESLAVTGDHAQALVEVERGLDYAPDDSDLLLLKGIFLHYLDRETESQIAFGAAQAAAGSRRNFLLERARNYQILGDYDAVLVDAQAAIALDAEAPFGYFYLAQAQVALGEQQAAYENYEKAAALATAAGETELEAMARIQIGYLLQRMAVPQD